MTPAGQEPTDPGRRRIGLPSATILVVASMIGSGAFTTSGFALADLGSVGRVLFAWVLGGLVATSGALCYGALARVLPESGGEYAYLTRTVHPLAGFLAGWVSLLAGFTAPIAVAALGLQAYLASSFELSGDPRWVGSGAVLLAGLLHGMRLDPGLRAQNVLVGIKLLLIALFIGLGVWGLAGRPPVPAPRAVPFDPGALAVSLVWISFAYSGFNAAIYVGGEVRDPVRNLPRSLLWGTLGVTVVYLLLNAVFLLAAPASELAGRPDVGTVAAQALGGAGMRRLLAGIVTLALFSSISSMVLSGPRVYARMARDGVFPRLLAFEGQVPGRAVALQCALSIAVVWVAELRQLLTYVGFTLGLCAAASVLGLLRLRRVRGAARVPIPFFPLTPILFLGATLPACFFLVLREPAQAFYGGVTALSGGLLYAFVRRGGSGLPPQGVSR